MAERIAVIGAGVSGLSAAWALRREGFECSVYESGAPGGGQSAGESRIFRHAHADPRQFRLAVDARRHWRDWEAEFGVQLISPDGSMVLGEAAVSKLDRYRDEPAIEVIDLDAEGVSRMLPIMSGFEGPAMIDEAAGAIRTRLTLANLIRGVGTDLVPEKVDQVVPLQGGGAEVVTALHRRQFDAAVVCAGTNTAKLAAHSGVEIAWSLKTHVRLSFPLDFGDRQTRLACFQDSSGQFGETNAYGSPVRGNRFYSVGLAESTPPEKPELLDALADRTRSYVRKAMPGLFSAEDSVIHCWVTELPWAADGLAIWQEQDIYFLAGHNMFKLAPTIGRALARSVADGEVESGFRPGDRLGEPIPETAGSTGS